MSKKAHYCDECIYHHFPKGDLSRNYLECKKGHKPRFYNPRTMDGDFGWKRRCDDFKAIRDE